MRAIIFFLVLITKYVSSYLIISIQDRHPLCHLSHSSSYMSYDTEYTRAKASYNDGMLSLNEELTSYLSDTITDDLAQMYQGIINLYIRSILTLTIIIIIRFIKKGEIKFYASSCRNRK